MIDLRRMCLGNSRFLLVEMPYAHWSERMIRQVCDLPVQQGVIPVLAHVDRYRRILRYPPRRQQYLYRYARSAAFGGAS